MNPYAAPPVPAAAPARLVGVNVPVPGLEGRVFVRERAFFGRPGFIVDGTFRTARRGVLEIPDATGRVHRLRIRGFFLDPCPRVEVDGEILDVFPRLPAGVSVLCSVPVLLVFGGGALGAILGVFAVFGNFRIARSRFPALLRLALGATVTAAAFGCMIAIGTIIHLLTH